MEDTKIIELLWQRDEGGLQEAKEKYGGFCGNLANNLLGNWQTAEECWSDALLHLWNTVPPERPLHLRAYLAKLTRSIAIDRLRLENAEKRGGGETAALLDELAECVSGKEDTESEAFSRALGEEISRFLSSLPARQSQLFIRRYFHGDTVNALAKRFGMKTNSVTVSLLRTRSALRSYLEKEGYTL
ncbi:MAG: sigma-70 family RNA polymerase sigma factor [Oscillospiraceae bacterium]|nr:sigma-70 family RNA polymerase sigma factor [Oscillospiraceae bacterium]